MDILSATSALPAAPIEGGASRKGKSDDGAEFNAELALAGVEANSTPQKDSNSLSMDPDGNPGGEVKADGTNSQIVNSGPEQAGVILETAVDGRAGLQRYPVSVEDVQSSKGGVSINSAATSKTVQLDPAMKPEDIVKALGDRIQAKGGGQETGASLPNPVKTGAIQDPLGTSPAGSGSPVSPETGAMLDSAAILRQVHRLGGEAETGPSRPGSRVSADGVSTEPVAGASGAGSMGGEDFVGTLMGVRAASREGAGSGSGNGSGELNLTDSGREAKVSGKGAGLAQSQRLKTADPGRLQANAFRPDLIGAVSAGPIPQKSAPLPRLNVTGHVVSGSMARNRLSHEALLNIRSGVMQLKNAGGGEIRIRLKPDHLGELNLKVQTSGKDVGLTVQTTNRHAMRILEESMGDLREKLASQNLSLGKVDVNFAPGARSAAGSDSYGNQNDGQGPSFEQQLTGRGHDERRSASHDLSGNSDWNDRENRGGDVRAQPPGMNPIAVGSSRHQAAPGRIDVVA